MKFSLLIEAAQRGDPAAAFACGLALENGWSVKPSVAEAQKWYKLAANSLPIAKYALAKSLTVHGDPDSLGPGFAKAAAELGLVQAATFLGLLYRHGNGVEKSEDEATRWLSLASESGDGRATAALGSPFFQSETGTCLDVSKALPGASLGA